MKLRVILTIVFILLGLVILPLTNVIIGLPDYKKGSFREKYYSLDYLNFLVAEMVKPLGISLRPGQVVVGKNDWLFLGDEYSSSISRYRYNREAPAFLPKKKKITRINLEDLERVFTSIGIKKHFWFIAPEKGTIYPELFPDWVTGARNPILTKTIKEESDKLYLLEGGLLKAKSESQPYLYEAHDSHWSQYGAWIGYLEIGNRLNKLGLNYEWLDESDVEIKEVNRTRGPDLCRLLGLSPSETSNDLEVFIHGQSEIALLEGNLESNSELRSVKFSKRLIGTQVLRTYAENALNKSRILWVRDSFGDQLGRYMASTFSDIVEVHIDKFGAEPELMRSIIGKFDPDFAIVTVAERQFFKW